MFNVQTGQIFYDSSIQTYGLNSISLNDQFHFQQIFNNLKSPISDYTFANNYIWSQSCHVCWAMYHRHLCVFVIEKETMHMFMPPMGEFGATIDDLKNALMQCFEVLNEFNGQFGHPLAGTIQYVSDELVERIKECNLEGLIIAPSPNGKDYIYDMQKMITLSGNSLASKRHAKNKFVREYPSFHMEPLSNHDISACMKLLDTWYNHKIHHTQCGQQELTTHYYEKVGCEIALSYKSELNLKGMVLFAGHEPVGFTFGEILTDEQIFVVIEKTHPDFSGAAALIFSEFCSQYWSNYSECNVGDHANIPSLRFAKEQYRPVRLLNKSIIMQSKEMIRKF